MVPSVFGMYRRCMHNSVIDLTWCLFCDFLTKNVIIQTWSNRNSNTPCVIFAGRGCGRPRRRRGRWRPRRRRGRGSSALSTSTVRSLSLGHASEMPRRRAVFVKVRSLNQDWRTGTLLIHLNLDIHKLSNVIRPLFEEVHWRQILFAKFCFRDNFEGIKPNGC